MSKTYTGIGSRETPRPMQDNIFVIATTLAERGWTLRSGGAKGADKAFENGCVFAEGSKEIYLPWKGFNGNTSELYIANYNCSQREVAEKIASSIHPAWNKLKYGAKLLHTRNVFQVLGWDLKTPSELVICWTKGGKSQGGTRTALELAKVHSIPIINLCTDTIDWSVFK